MTAGITKQDFAGRERRRTLKRRHHWGGGNTAGIAKQDFVGRGHWRSLKTRHCKGGNTTAGILKQDIVGRGCQRTLEKYQNEMKKISIGIITGGTLLWKVLLEPVVC